MRKKLARSQCWTKYKENGTGWDTYQEEQKGITARPQRKTATRKYLEKRSRERNVDSRIQVQLEEDGGGSTRQSWMETSGLWPVFHRVRQGINHVSQYLLVQSSELITHFIIMDNFITNLFLRLYDTFSEYFTSIKHLFWI